MTPGSGRGTAGRVQVKILGWIHIVLATAGLALSGWFCFYLWLLTDGLADALFALAAPILLILAALLFVPQLIGGIGLLRGKGWAGILIILLSVLLLFLFPIGTLLGGFGLWTLMVRDPDPMPAPTNG